MPDPEEPSVEPVPEWDRGDDYTETERALRAARARSRDLTDAKRRLEEDEQELLDEETEAAHLERVELARNDQQTLEESRIRDQLDAAADTSRAIQLAHADELKRDVHRQYAANDKQRSLGDNAHGQHLRDVAAVDPDQAGLAEEGRRFQNLANQEARRSAGEDQIADEYDASAQDHRDDAQASAAGAVNPPEGPPEAQLPQDRLHVRGYGQVRDTKGNLVRPAADPSKTPDLSMNRPRER
ncbi:hypothetical protein [Kribbella sp. NPDC004536]|uniref:hypothetical protein n=1 Tax=Kribbella sp. NPDC004536 TaxID=3364106 RepID=UPI0036748688